MIPLSQVNTQSKSWQQQLASAKITVKELLDFLELRPEQLTYSEVADQQFKLKVSWDFLNCIDKGNPDDPLLKQILPIAAEMQDWPGFGKNPVGDLEASVVPGLIHKYPSRVLLISSPACGIHCRYCFRRHFPYSESYGQLDQALKYIKENQSINEVILSGGDPLTMSDEQLLQLIDKIQNIAHVQTLRIHSRMPVILPDRLTDSLSKGLQSSRLQTVMVIHCNHPSELSGYLRKGLQRFSFPALTLLNQSVLLKGVNDNSDILVELSHKLFSMGILPYYLHMLDRVEGAGHFSVALKNAIELHKTMRSQLPGYLVPQLIRDDNGRPFKENAY